MSVSLDASVNALVQQSMSMQSEQLASVQQVKLLKGAMETQEAAVMKLISAVGLETYNSAGQLSQVAATGSQFSAVG